jgi:hypothetical protein
MLVAGMRREKQVDTSLRRKLMWVWLAALSLCCAYLAMGAAAPQRTVAHFDEIDVQRINVREPDGTIRMIISNRAAGPGIIVKNQEHRHPGGRQDAGMIFFNDEGTENGGLVFDGSRKGADADSDGSLTFDPYEQDQVVQLFQSEQDGRRSSGLKVFERSATSMPYNLFDDTSPEGQAALKRWGEEDAKHRAVRIFAGRTYDGVAQMELRDSRNLVRLRLSVAPDGAASIEFLDASGKVTRRIADSER